MKSRWFLLLASLAPWRFTFFLAPSGHGHVFRKSALAAAAILYLCGCDSPPTPKKDGPSPPAASTARPSNQHVEWVKMQKGADPPTFVKAERERAEKAGKKLLIYVGASWCEPCQYFHKAAESGQLDAQLGDLRLIDLDHDQDEAIVSALSCDSKMIPLFALPNADGLCTTDKRVEGGIKGEGAVAYLAPKVRALVGP